MTSILSNLQPNITASVNEDRGNLSLQFSDVLLLDAPEVSDLWHIGQRTIEFLQLPPDASTEVALENGTVLAKVIIGELTDPARKPFSPPKTVTDTRLNQTRITAGHEGALLALFNIPASAEEPVTSMAQLGFSGPLADQLQWRTFHQQFLGVTDIFAGADAYIGPGFHLLDSKGDEISYLNLWTAGKGEDLTTHNHGHPPSPLAPAFTETHLTISNGTGKGGMYECSEPGAADRRYYPVPTGHEHGPFFEFDAHSGEPVLLDNGAVKYPWHGWQAAADDAQEQAYDFVAAFETAPAYTRVPCPQRT